MTVERPPTSESSAILWEGEEPIDTCLAAQSTLPGDDAERYGERIRDLEKEIADLRNVNEALTALLVHFVSELGPASGLMSRTT
ncbi:hypothetical protein PV350_43295 [Streptomyces sp. PA03-6a]|nr:hypothetical protein [Streptomyces sp. PA03-6a]